MLHGLVVKNYLKPGQMENHKNNCFTYDSANIVMPELGKNIIQFKDWRKQEKTPYITNAEFESIIKKNSKKISMFEISR